jgi:hypothetical protein
MQAALNLDASVARAGVYGEAGEALWVLSHTEGLHLWEWQAACDEEAAGTRPRMHAACIMLYLPTRYRGLDALTKHVACRWRGVPGRCIGC